jgi:protein-L-isoaspartate(D-aspartate) O-methyltransferase
MNFEDKNNIMIEQYLIARGIKSNSVINAFKQVKRHLFVREEDIFFAYDDFPLDIGFNQTISQPYIVALMIEYLNIDKNDKVLEIGTGSGYQTAILSRIAKEVYTLELNKYLAKEAKRKLTELEYKNITFKYGNGYDGFSEYAPYDKIIVSCAANKIPEKLINQLSEEGKMIIPIGSYSWQNLYLIEKNNKQIKTKKLDAVRFVPMKE